MAFLANGSWVPDGRSPSQMALAQQAPQTQNMPNFSNAMPQIGMSKPPMFGAGANSTPMQGNIVMNPPSQGMNAGGMSAQGMIGMSGVPLGQFGIGQFGAGQMPNEAKTSMLPLYNPLPQAPSTTMQAPQYTPNPMPAQAPTYAPTAMQAVNRSSPQDIQNFLKSMGSQQGNSNAWQNPQGMHGQGPQAGFQGFQQNGQMPQGPAPQQFQNQYSNLQSTPTTAKGYQASTQEQPGMLFTSPGTNAGGIKVGGTGGVVGQPGYHKPGGYGVGTNSPYAPGAGYGGNYSPSGPASARTSPGANQNTQQQGSASTGQVQNPPQPPQSGYVPPKKPSAPSDINSKENITLGDQELQSFLDSLNVYEYEYKDKKYGDGRRISPMAQEIEQTPLGKAAISTNEEGYKVVDYGKLGGTMLASLALLNHKYKKLEEELKQSILTGLKDKGKK